MSWRSSSARSWARSTSSVCVSAIAHYRRLGLGGDGRWLRDIRRPVFDEHRLAREAEHVLVEIVAPVVEPLDVVDGRIEVLAQEFPPGRVEDRARTAVQRLGVDLGDPLAHVPLAVAVDELP